MTAVEWLLNEWPILESQLPIRIVEQAKEMEKEQIKQAFKDGRITMLPISGERYFEMQYGKGGKP